MPSDPLLRRRSIRLKGYDYAQNGEYFITICTHESEHLFGEIVDYEMRLNAFGGIVEDCWLQVPHHFRNVEVDAFVVMPNHVHGILVILAPTTPRKSFHPGPLPGSLGAIVRSFKSAVTKRINEVRRTPGLTVWQRNHHEHIIRNPTELQKLRKYIEGNPARWAEDRYYSDTP